MARDRCVTAMKIYFPFIVLVYDYLKLVKTSQKWQHMLRESFEMKGRVTRDNTVIRHRKNQEVLIKCSSTHLKN